MIVSDYDEDVLEVALQDFEDEDNVIAKMWHSSIVIPELDRIRVGVLTPLEQVLNVRVRVVGLKPRSLYTKDL